jgi:hypothetical protein
MLLREAQFAAPAAVRMRRDLKASENAQSLVVFDSIATSTDTRHDSFVS